MLFSLLIFVLACGGRPPAVPSDTAGRTWALSVDVPFTELVIPPDNRPNGAAPPEAIPIAGPWKEGAREGAKQHWVTALPVRPRSLFFFRPPEGMALLGSNGVELPYGQRAPGWRFDATTLDLALPAAQEGPKPGDFTLRYPFATEREAALNHRFSGIEEPEDFVRTRIQVGAESLAGLLLPAPGVAAWEIDVPPSAELSFRPGIVLPETADAPPTDGADATVEVEDSGKVEVVWSASLTGPSFDSIRLDLSRFAGRHVKLRFRTNPGTSPTFDYVFFADPVVAARKANPRRVILVFVDAMRRDHLGLYGYARDTSVSLDTLAQKSVVFDTARSVAPWTLPSARALLTGRQPEEYDRAETLQGRLRTQGFATAMFAGNVYLSSNFDMNRDWGLHHVVNWPRAGEQVDRALAWLKEQDGRDALLLLHFMDPHLPYLEPLTYRYRYAPMDPPGKLGERFDRTTLLRQRPRSPVERQYIQDRYDNNVAFVHDELARVFNSLRDDDIVVYFADHGEEFWDHNGFEHGHTLFDELLRVPLVLKAPGLPPARVAEPVSLLDVAPTLLDLLGTPLGEVDGVSLVPALRGDSAARQALAERDIAFGRPLYGPERWGVAHDGAKYTTSEGREAVYDIAMDPRETTNILANAEGDLGGEWRGYLQEALQTPVRLGYRMTTTAASKPPQDDFVAELVVPGGVADAWVGADPTNKSSAEVSVSGEVVVGRWHAGFSGAREIFVVPVLPVPEVTPGLVLHIPRSDGTMETETVPPARDPLPGDARTPLMRSRASDRTVAVTFGIAPHPSAEDKPLNARDAEVEDALRALGYVFEE